MRPLAVHVSGLRHVPALRVRLGRTLIVIMSISFDPQGPPDPNDPRILPSMRFTLIRSRGKTYVEWSISKGLALGAPAGLVTVSLAIPITHS